VSNTTNETREREREAREEVLSATRRRSHLGFNVLETLRGGIVLKCGKC
jgi:hypothetical protein